MTISRIAKTKQGRFSLFDENGDFLFSIDGETMVKNHVREGAALDAASLEALKEQSDTRKAKDKALGYLSCATMHRVSCMTSCAENSTPARRLRPWLKCSGWV